MKKLALAVGSLAALLVAVPSSTAGPAGAAFVSLPRAAAPGELSQYGHIRALVKTGSSYRLRFDPAFWLTGLTANKAAAEDGVVAPGEPVHEDPLPSGRVGDRVDHVHVLHPDRPGEPLDGDLAGRLVLERAAGGRVLLPSGHRGRAIR